MSSTQGPSKTRQSAKRRAAAARSREVLKIGVAVIAMGRLLLVRKRGTRNYILPGGKPERGEDDLQTLSREIEEELGCKVNPETISFLGSFSDVAADLFDTIVTVRLYAAELIGDPTPQAEIETLKWYSPRLDSGEILAPSLQNKIIPFLSEQKRVEPGESRRA